VLLDPHTPSGAAAVFDLPQQLDANSIEAASCCIPCIQRCSKQLENVALHVFLSTTRLHELADHH